jgi:cyclomaltodextrinase
MSHWSEDAIFYHIYPLGCCGAPERNDFQAAPVNRLEKLYPWAEYIAAQEMNAVYLGPVFESGAHGYDTADYFHVDRRLGDRKSLSELVRFFHECGVRVILDGVFNHVGRNFWAFRDVQQRGPESPYCGWFAGLRFGCSNRHGDPFCYDTWNGYETLVKLNLGHPDVRSHLLQAVEQWITDYDIDGLRLDAADSIALDFLSELAGFCRRLRPDFWLMGEVVHGDYRRWANPQTLDSVTNYEAYKGLYSSHNDHNYFEIAYSLNRQFGESGLYRNLPLYNFADNHDVSRVASTLKNPAHLAPLYTLLLTLPGVPSVYYGSEFGLTGVKKEHGSDAPLRPALDLAQLQARPPQPGLPNVIRRLIHLRRELPALRHGGYRQVHVSSEQFAFLRTGDPETVLVAVNASDQKASLTLSGLGIPDGLLTDLFNPGERILVKDGQARLEIQPGGVRILI